MNKNIIKMCIVSLLLSFQYIVFSQEPVKIERMTGPVRFDGVPDDDSWKSLNPFQLLMFRPNFGNKPSEESDIRIGYDNEFLWVGAKLYMNDASEIFSYTKKRDEMLFSNDAFGILLDSYNDNENALAFFTAPTGLRTDYAISNDASGGGGGPGFMSAMNSSWNTFWDVKTTQDDEGWYVEMRIPFSSLKYKPENDEAIMGLIISRSISANNETDTWPAIDPKYGFMATNKPSQAGKILIEGARPTKPVYLSPYAIGGFTRDYSLNEDFTEYVKTDNPDYNAGLDLKYNINSNLSLDITANTDFAQVEADDQQVNLTRYSLFFPEKRMFFQERASIFNFSLGGRADNLFYSRNIGIVGETPVKLYGGARLVGRIGGWDMGVMDMQTEKYDLTPSENFGILRLRRQIINPNSYVGAIFTSRVGTNGKYNFAYGVDGIFRLFGDDYINIKVAQSYDDTISSHITSIDPSFFLVNWERRSEKGFAYEFNYSYSGQKFNPGIGFVIRSSVQGITGRLLYGWIPGEKSKLLNYNINVRANQYNRIEDGNLESMQISPGFEINTKKDLHAEISLEIQKEGVLEDFPLSDSIWINAGEYSFTGIQARYGTSNSRKISVRGSIDAGQFYDGTRIGLRATTNFNFSSSFTLTPEYEFNAIRFPDRLKNNSLNIHSLNVKALLMFSTKLSASFLVQYVNTYDEFIGNFRLRFNPREGNDFYLVYNDYRAVSKRNSVPAIPPYFNRTIMVKYTHTFIL
jgi:hypothetical protein